VFYRYCTSILQASLLGKEVNIDNLDPLLATKSAREILFSSGSGATATNQKYKILNKALTWDLVSDHLVDCRAADPCFDETDSVQVEQTTFDAKYGESILVTTVDGFPGGASNETYVGWDIVIEWDFPAFDKPNYVMEAQLAMIDYFDVVSKKKTKQNGKNMKTM